MPRVPRARPGPPAALPSPSFNRYNCRKLESVDTKTRAGRSEEHTSELQSLRHLVCRLLLEKKKERHTYSLPLVLPLPLPSLSYHPPPPQIYTLSLHDALPICTSRSYCLMICSNAARSARSARPSSGTAIAVIQ